MNVYNEAHNLAKAIKECDEFKKYNELKKSANANPELAKMIADFQAQQMQLQLKQMSGEQMDAEFMSKVQELYGIITKDPLAAQYMQAEMTFSLMMNDVYKILGEAMGGAPANTDSNE